jgi:hypothetical protein
MMQWRCFMDTWKYASECSAAAPEPLAEFELSMVSGGGTAEYAATGFGVGGIVGTIAGAAVFGSVAGAGNFGTLGALIGFSFGLGWGIGRNLRRLIYHR